MLTIIKKNIIYIILLLTFFLRFYKIGSYPSLNPDEAALGYNAYSLIETGRDEHGNSWPLHFKSFGDFKPGGYVYLAIPFVNILGVIPLAVRLPNLILSVLSVYFLYKIILLLTFNFQLSTLSAFILAVSPWHIHFSRGAWESSSALSLIIIGTYFFYLSKVKNCSRNFLLFAIFYSLSLYVYHSARIFAPMLALTLFFIHKPYLTNHKSKLILPIIIGILICLPVFLSFLQNGGATRFSGIGLTADLGPLSRSHELLNGHPGISLPARLAHNKKTLYLISWMDKYLSHFNPNFLFVSGDEVPRSKIPDMGQLYFIELPFLVYGIYCLIRKPYLSSHKSLILSWLLLAPFASSLTFQSPSALRSLPLVIPLTVLISLGLYSFFIQFRLAAVYSLLLAVYSFSFVYYLDVYYAHYEKRYPFAWNYGFDQLVPYLESQKNLYPNIYLTDKYDQPYILYLFFSRYPPQTLHSQIRLTPPDKYGFSTVSQIDNIKFQKINWADIPSGSLVVAGDELIPFDPQTIINFPNGQPGFKIYIK